MVFTCEKLVAVLLTALCTSVLAAPFSAKGFSWSLSTEGAIKVIENAGGKFDDYDLKRLRPPIEEEVEKNKQEDETDQQQAAVEKPAKRARAPAGGGAGEVDLTVQGWSIGGIQVTSLFIRGNWPSEMLGFDTPNNVDAAFARYKKQYGNPAAMWSNPSANAYGQKINNFTAIWQFSDGSQIRMVRALTMKNGVVMYYSPRFVQDEAQQSRAVDKKNNSDF